MTVLADGAGIVHEPVRSLTIRVNPGAVSANRSLATGLGVIRVTPFPW